MSSTVGSAPEWLQHIEQNVKPGDQMTTVYGLSTLSAEGLPKSRMVIHRKMSPSNLFMTTTDLRMKKAEHLAKNHAVELVWWIDPTAVQFRITGKAYVIPPASAQSKEEIQKTLDAMGLDSGAEDGQADWWEKERMDMWHNAMSGHLRASFARPQPGMPLEDAPPADEWPVSLEPESDDPKKKQQIKEALDHFSMLAIKAEGFEMLELKPTPNRRTHWNRGEDGFWKKQSVCP